MKRCAVVAVEVAVEEAREQAVERPVSEREIERVPLDERRVRRLASRLVEHLARLVEAGYVSVQVARQEAGAAGDVERPGGGKGRDLAEQAA